MSSPLGNSLTSQGLTTATQPQLLSYFTSAYQFIYGSSINLASNTPDGQWMNIQIQAILDVQDLLTQVYNSMDPDNAIGVQLDQRVAINGIQRQAGTYSTTNITVVLTQSVNLYGLDQSTQPIYTVSDNAGNQWQLITTQLGVGPGTEVYSFQSSSPGANLTIPNTITVPVTIVLGVQSVNNPTAQSVIGINQETDAALRIRRQQSVSISSQGYLQGLLATLLNIEGITSANVYENNTSSTNADGVPGHSIWVIVSGNPVVVPTTAYNPSTTYSYGQIVTSNNVNYISWQNNNLNNAVTNASFWGVYNPVAEAIYNKRNAGCGMFGQTAYTVTQIDGSPFIVDWDVVAPINLFISFTATSINGINQPNIAGIITGIVDNFVPTVYQEVNINALATIVQQVDPNTLVTNAGFSIASTQIATLSGTAASGTFELSYNGNNTVAINWNDSTATIQSKLRAVTGLSAATVTGTIAGGTLTIALGITSISSLITVVNNSLMTSAPAAITFSWNEGYTNTLLPASKKDQFVVASTQIIILPMILSPTTVTVISTKTQTFTGLGGYGTFVYSLQTNVSGGSINSSTGVYTAGATPGTDIALVTDSFGNTAISTITVTA
jgi:hypothetical protein